MADTRGAAGMGVAGAGDVYTSWKESRRAMADYEEKVSREMRSIDQKLLHY